MRFNCTVKRAAFRYKQGWCGRWAVHRNGLSTLRWFDTVEDAIIIAEGVRPNES